MSRGSIGGRTPVAHEPAPAAQYTRGGVASGVAPDFGSSSWVPIAPIADASLPATVDAIAGVGDGERYAYLLVNQTGGKTALVRFDITDESYTVLDADAHVYEGAFSSGPPNNLWLYGDLLSTFNASYNGTGQNVSTYDLTSGTWSIVYDELPDENIGGFDVPVVSSLSQKVHVGDAVYVFGGRANKFAGNIPYNTPAWSQRTWKLDLIGGGWTEVSPMPDDVTFYDGQDDLRGASGAAVDGKIYAVLEFSTSFYPSGSGAFSAFHGYFYDPDLDAWSILDLPADMPYSLVGVGGDGTNFGNLALPYGMGSLIDGSLTFGIGWGHTGVSAQWWRLRSNSTPSPYYETLAPLTLFNTGGFHYPNVHVNFGGTIYAFSARGGAGQDAAKLTL